MGPLDKFILRDNALSLNDGEIQIKFQSHWYRSLPLSCMDVTVTINGQPVDENDMMIEANGNQYPVRRMPELDKEWLFITDAATLHVKNNQSLQKGKQYEVALNLDLHIPYIIVGKDGSALLASSSVTKKLICN